jgi:Putative prokaryotic signal transducing protein
MNDLVVLATASSPIEAELMCQRLEGEGIPATYMGRDAGADRAVPAIGPLTVHVLEHDAERAVAALRRIRGY